MTLQYDPSKNTRNLRKHGIPLDAGLDAINDPDVIVLPDEKHSEIEERFVAIGRCGNQILFVSFMMRDGAERLISVRKAEPNEEAEYWKQYGA